MPENGFTPEEFRSSKPEELGINVGKEPIYTRESSNTTETPQTGRLKSWLNECKTNAINNTINHPWLAGALALYPAAGVAVMAPPEKQGGVFMLTLGLEGASVIVGPAVADGVKSAVNRLKGNKPNA